MSESAAGRSDPRFEELSKELQALKCELANLNRWRPSIEKGLQTALSESRGAIGEVTSLKEKLRERGTSAFIPVPDWPLPWEIDNSSRTELELAHSFDDGLNTLERDASLRAGFLSKLRGILADPKGFGKWLNGARKGQKSARVANNYRVVWTPIGNRVRLELFCSKEDRRYSPFGA